MFGWKFHSRGELAPAYLFAFGFSFEVERRDNMRFLRLGIGGKGWTWCKLDPPFTRSTGPEDNAAVLWHFRNGPERRPRGAAFHSGFEEAAAKGPVTVAEVTGSWDRYTDMRFRAMRNALDIITVAERLDIKPIPSHPTVVNPRPPEGDTEAGFNPRWGDDCQ